MNQKNQGPGRPSGSVYAHPYFRFSLFLLLTLSFTACQPDEDFIPEPTGGPGILNEGSAAFQEMILDINDLRAEGCRCGNTNMPPVGPLQWNDQIAIAAAEHSADMAQAGVLNHTGTDGSLAGDRLKRNGYDWRSYGENIASGFTSMDGVLQAWIDSPGHCRNLMNASFQEIGIARQGNYWTQVFASPL
ncbi:MAG: CAP domain-containing protein [Bacteroidota bacterium]